MNKQIIRIVASFVLILCLTTPYITSIASAYIMATHTHVCDNDKHEEDCAGTKKCCSVCIGINSEKNNPSYFSMVNRLSTAFTPAIPALVVCFVCPNISYISLVSLKVRLDN